MTLTPTYGPISLRQFGAVGDGSTDDYAALQAAVVSGAVLQGEPGRTYMVSQPLVLPSAGPFSLNLNGATIKASAVMDSVILKSDHTYTSVLWKIHNGVIHGNTKAAAGIRIDNGNFFEIEDVQVQDVTACGIDLGGTSGLQVYEGTMRRIRVIGMVSGTAANRPATGIWFGTNATDYFMSQTFIKNFKTYGVRMQGAMNMLHQVHVYGYPEPDYAIDYHFHVTGSGNKMGQCYSDGPYVAGFYLDAANFNCDNNVVLWNASSPPTDAVGFHVTSTPTSGAWTCQSNSVLATAAVTLAATNIDYLYDQADGNALGNGSSISARGGTSRATSRTNQPVVLGSTFDAGSVKITPIPISTSTALSAGAQNYHVTTGASTITCTLPTAVNVTPGGAGAGKRYRVVKLDSGAGTVVVTPAGSEKINGASSKTISGQYSALDIESDGANWFIVSQIGTVS